MRAVFQFVFPSNFHEDENAMKESSRTADFIDWALPYDGGHASNMDLGTVQTIEKSGMVAAC